MDAFLVHGVRSPFGRHGGLLARKRPDDLMADVVKALMAGTGVAPAAIEDVIVGCTNQAGEDCRNVARHAGLLAGLPVEAAGLTVNRLCGSGLAAILDAARCVSLGQGDLIVAGGVESMTRAPFVLSKSEEAFSRAAQIFDTTLGARFPNGAFTAAFGDDSMPQTAENVARELDISRDAADAFALASQQKYAKAHAAGYFVDEIVPIDVPAKGSHKTAIAEDEHPRPATTPEQLAKLRPIHPGGIVTAGNASGLNDGAAAVLVANGASCERLGLRPIARLRAGAVAGVPPRTMGLGPVPAILKVLERSGLALSDIDVIEINEAFAAQVLGCTKRLGIGGDDPRLNPNGGAIAIGHPLGASGSRVALTAARELRRRGGRYALASLCIGVGQGIALLLEAA